MDMEPEFFRAIEFSRAFDRRRTERVVRTAHGEALLTPSLPLVHGRNHLSVDLGADVAAAELIEALEPVAREAGLRHRKITVDDDLGARVAPEFRELGWRVEELLVMVHRGELRTVDTSAAEEVSAEDLEPRWLEGMREEVSDEEEIRQLLAAHHGRRLGAEVRYFAARVDGEIASYCELFLADGVGQIESVLTLERYRNRGLAKAVVTRALEESVRADSELTFLCASADDWPQELYRTLGFETAGRMWDFLLNPPAT